MAELIPLRRPHERTVKLTGALRYSEERRS